MPRASIEYMNARRAVKAAAGGAKQNHRVEYRPDSEADGYDHAMADIGAFSLWAELSRQQLVAKLGIPQPQSETEIPF